MPVYTGKKTAFVKAEPLSHRALTHAHLKPVWQPELRAEINSRTAVKYLRFMRRVSIERLELPRHVYGRWAPCMEWQSSKACLARRSRNGGRQRWIEAG
jgi:hypothetical protein